MVDRVPFLDLTREYEEFGDEMTEAIESVLSSGYFVLGDHVAEFEETFANYTGAEYGIGVNSGSDALYLVLRALDIQKGDEVILPSHTFVSTADAVVRNGATPVFVDIDPETYTIDPEAVNEQVTPDTAAVIPVHLYGQPADMAPLQELAAEHEFAIVEDASQAHGAKYRGEPVGSLGDIACFSLYPTKNLGAYGDAGIVVSDNAELADRVEMARQYGESERYEYEFVGVNSRLDELQAAVLNYKLTRLDELNARRQQVAEQYRKRLDSVETPSVRSDSEHVYHLYVIQCSERDELQAYLLDNGVQTLIHYPTPIHKQPSYRAVGRRGDLRVTERIANRILSLPMHPFCTQEEVENVATLIQEY
jgi:dTDP-4-amino-4,6-dideoxygalactose transaminase